PVGYLLMSLRVRRPRNASAPGPVLDVQLEQRITQRLAVRVESERGRDTAAERALAHELQRPQSRQLVAPDVAHNNALQMFPDRIDGHALGQQRIVFCPIRDQRQDRRIALVAVPAVRQVMQPGHFATTPWASLSWPPARSPSTSGV